MSIEIGDGGLGYIYLGDLLIAGGGGGGGLITLDFQNDGQLGTTLTPTNTNYSSYGVESGQGIYLAMTSSSQSGGLKIALPSSVFNGKALKKIKLYAYYPTSGKYAFGVQRNSGVVFRYSEESSYIGYIGFADGDSTKQNVGTMNGELTMEINFTSNSVSGTIGNASYAISSSNAGVLMSDWVAGTLCLHLTNWLSTSKIYLRKAVIETE